MRPITLHPLSVLAGVGILAMSLLTAGARFQLPAQTQAIAGIPAPRQMVRIEQGDLFAVPPGKIFVATGVGASDVSNDFLVNIHFDGNIVFVISVLAAAPLRTIPPGLTAFGGTEITLTGSHDGVLLGYLAPS